MGAVLTLAQVRAIGRSGEFYRQIGTEHVYRFVELRDGTGFQRGAEFSLVGRDG